MTNVSAMGRDAVLARVEHLIGKLSRPLPQSEIEAGWTERSRENYLRYFQDLRLRLLDPKPLEKAERDVSIARGMDHWSIMDGELIEDAAWISNRLRELEEDQRAVSQCRPRQVSQRKG